MSVKIKLELEITAPGGSTSALQRLYAFGRELLEDEWTIRTRKAEILSEEEFNAPESK